MRASKHAYNAKREKSSLCIYHAAPGKTIRPHDRDAKLKARFEKPGSESPFWKLALKAQPFSAATHCGRHSSSRTPWLASALSI